MKRSLLITIIFAILASLTLLSCSSNKKMINNNVVENLEIDKFIGTWYEIARYQHRFEKDLVGVTATYSLEKNDRIKVVNKGYKEKLDGKEKSITGKAKIPDPQNPGNLKVSFFWIFYSDYLVMELDEENYQWAVIGSSSPNYLWILSRNPEMDEKLYKNLLSRIEKRGYDISKLYMVPQKLVAAL